MQFECSHIFEIDKNGDVIWEKLLPWLDLGLNSMVIENDTIFISGNHPNRDRWLWHQMSANGGDSLATYEIADPNNIYQCMSNFGTVKLKDKFCIYGSGEIGTFETSLLHFVDHKGQLDTLVELFTTDVDSDPWEIIPDNEGNLTAFIRYREGGKNRQRLVAKINDDKDLIWAYFSEENSQQEAIPNGAILLDGTVVYNSRDNFFRGENLRGIGSDSTIVWEHNSLDVSGLSREYTKIHTLDDGNILGVGEYSNIISTTDPEIFDAPYITQVNEDMSKEWERAYYAIEEDGNNTQLGSLRDAVELSDGSIIAIGWIKQGPLFPFEILIMRLDEEGCLTLDCPVLNNITEVLSSSTEIARIDFDIYPNPVSNILTVQASTIPQKIEVYGIDGSMHLVTEETEQINVSSLAEGLYVLRIYTDAGAGVRKFLKE